MNDFDNNNNEKKNLLSLEIYRIFIFYAQDVTDIRYTPNAEKSKSVLCYVKQFK